METINLNKSYDDLYVLAFQDSMTGVYSRNMLEELRETFDTKDLYVTFIDLDALKFVNDNYGHKAGDEALKYVARKLMEVSEYVFRLGGDEFLIIHEKPVDFSFVQAQASRGTVRKTKHMTVAYAMHIADSLMYKEKKQHKEWGFGREITRVKGED